MSENRSNPDQFQLRLPPGLRDRIKLAAEQSSRSMNAEIVATLEDAYPAPRPIRPLSDLEVFYLQWHSGAWHTVDEDSWTRFRSGEASPQITEKMIEKQNYFIVAVLDDSKVLCNLIIHNYMNTDDGYVGAPFELLNESEKKEYNRLMIASTATKDDERRLHELRTKMEPAFALPPSSIPMLREVLMRIAPENVVDDLMRKRGILN